MLQIQTEVPGLSVSIDQTGTLYLADVAVGMLFPAERIAVESAVRRAKTKPTEGAVYLTLEGIERETIADALTELDGAWREL